MPAWLTVVGIGDGGLECLAPEQRAAIDAARHVLGGARHLAMLDGAELAQALAAHPSDMDAALLAYETALFARSSAAAAESERILRLCFDDDAPHSLVRFFTGMRDAGPAREV